MQIRYLGNSGFAFLWEERLLVVDCYNPGAHPWLFESAASKQSVTVLASHRHSDHFSKDMLTLPHATFLFGYDIRAEANANYLRPGEEAVVNGFSVRAFGSTDEGVSFAVQTEDGTRLFHAGDLNNWHWRDEGGDDYAKQAETQFLAELELVRAGVPSPALACFPVDPRMGSDYFRGAVQFASALRPRLFVPMHFGAAFNPPAAFFKEMQPLTTLFTQPLLENEWVTVPL